MEATTIDGQKYLVPKLYLANSTLDGLLNQTNPVNNNIASNSTIFAGRDLTLNIGKNLINTNSTILAKNNLNLTANNIINQTTIGAVGSGKLFNSKSTIGSLTGNTNLTALKALDGSGGNIINIGSSIKAGNNLTLVAGNNITNKALVDYKINGTNYSNGNNLNDSGLSQITINQTNTKRIGNGLKGIQTTTTQVNTTVEDLVMNSNANNIKSTLLSQGNIESGGNLVMVAGNNINNIASNIKAGGSALLQATDGNINRVLTS